MDKYELYAGDSILTYSGHYLDVFNPDPACICIEDIAHALAQIPRFGGHLIRPLSVAEHCMNVAYKVPVQLGLDALLHDASEAYLMDIPSPIKRRLPDYKKLEENLTKVINAKFGIAYPKPIEIKAADKVCLEEEHERYRVAQDKRSYPMSNTLAEKYFLRLFEIFSGEEDCSG